MSHSNPGSIRFLVRAGCFGLMLATNVFAQSPPAKLDSFSYRAGVDVASNGGPFYQVALPIQVYQGAQRADFGDLRVFNGLGETVPHTLLRVRPVTSSQEKNISVPIFQITQNKTLHADGDSVALDVKRLPDGALVALPKNPDPGHEVVQVQGVIIDVSQIRDPVHALHMETGPSTLSFHAFSIETSDDLQQWNPVLRNAQLVHLSQSGQVIDKDDFNWESRSGKYLRILWAQPAEAPTIVGVSVMTTQAGRSNDRLLWTNPIPANIVENNNYDYPIPTHMPLEQIRIDLPQINTLVPLTVQRYVEADGPHPHGGWQTLARTVVYRLQSPQGELHSPDLSLMSMPVDRLRLQLDVSSGGMGNGVPTLQVGFVPQILVFLARGPGPFTLAWGSKDIGDASMRAESLIPNYTADGTFTASPATLGPIAVAADHPTSTARSLGTSKLVLWGTLVSGLLVLVGMVWVLVKQIQRGKSEQE